MTIDSFLIIAQKLIINSTGADGFNPNWAFENFIIIGRLWAMQFVKSFFLLLIIAFLFIGLAMWAKFKCLNSVFRCFFSLRKNGENYG